MKVTADHCTETSKGNPITFITEASTIGVPPGRRPGRLETDLGNGLDFCLKRVRADGTLVYDQEFGCTILEVLND